MAIPKLLRDTYFICHSEEDWEKLKLIVSYYYNDRRNQEIILLLEWDKNSKSQYFRISTEGYFGWDKSCIITDFKDRNSLNGYILKSLSDLFDNF